MSKTHELKTLPQFFEAVKSGDKTFEVRFNDRDFKVGDFLLLQEFTPSDGYTGAELLVRVSYILDDPAYCKDGFVVLGFGKGWVC